MPQAFQAAFAENKKQMRGKTRATDAVDAEAGALRCEIYVRESIATINRVAIDVSGDAYLDLEREAELMLMRE